MNAQDIVKTWRWRITRAGYTQDRLCQELQVSRSGLSQYLCGKQEPSLKMFDKIEGKLRELEACQNGSDTTQMP